MKIIVENIADAIAVLRPVTTEKSWRSFGDIHHLNRSIRANYISKYGTGLDKIALEIKEATGTNKDESYIIEDFLEFAIKYPTASKINAYLRKRKREQTTKKPKMIRLGMVNPKELKCLVGSIKKQLTTTEILDETAEFLDSPKFYFGKLLEVKACKSDIFSYSEYNQLRIIKAVRKEVEKTTRIRRKTPQQKAIGGINSEVVRLAYEDGKKGKGLRESKTYFKRAAKNVFQ